MLSANKRLIARLILCYLSLQPTLLWAEDDVTSARPDERILWQLYHAGKIGELNRQIDHLRRLYPLWRPPDDLLRALSGREIRVRKVKPNNIPRPSFCASAGRQWRLAEQEVREHNVARAVSRYRDLIRRCDTPLAGRTLEYARSILAVGDFIDLAEFARTYLSPEVVDKQVYIALKTDYLNESANSPQEPSALLQAKTVQFRDRQTATVIGWRYYNRNDYSRALDWFRRAEAWNGQGYDALLGQVLCLEKLKDYRRLIGRYEDIARPTAEIRAAAARAYKAMAWRHYDRQQWLQASSHVERARSIVGEDEEIMTLTAWIALKAKRLPAAAQMFERLYRQFPTKEHAQAYVLAQSQIGRKELIHKVEQYDGILAEEYRRFHARELYRRKQFQSAYLLAPDEFPALANIDSAYLDLEGGAQHRSGEEGRSHLDLYRLPSLTASYTVGGNHQFALNLSRIALYSGDLRHCASEIGGFPDTRFAVSCRQLARNQRLPEQRLEHALEVEFSYRKDGWFSPYASLGSTPIGGEIDPAATFRLGFVQQTGYGNWGMEAFSRPVRQSLLSYVGTEDPYQGKLTPMLNETGFDAWGRVLQTGFKTAQFVRFAERWNVYGKIEYAWLHGKNVDDNHTVSVALSLGRELMIEGFDYVTVGPSFFYQHFDKNLGHYTFGHGGYFSPNHYYNIGAGVNFLTDEGRDFIFKGRAAAGMQVIEEEGAPWFPLGDTTRGHYAGNDSSGEALDLELKGVYLLSSHFQVGAGAAYRKTNGYEDYTGGLFVRYTLEPRKAVFSRDIPQSLFDFYY